MPAPVQQTEATPGFEAEDIRVTCDNEDYQVTELESFQQAGFPPAFYEVMRQFKFERPTPIQKYGIDPKNQTDFLF